jgi:hypothetical protein
MRRDELKIYVCNRNAIHSAWVTAFETLKATLDPKPRLVRSDGFGNPCVQVRQWSNTFGRCICEEDLIPQSAVL